MVQALTRYLADGGERDAPYLNFTRLAIKNCEHTWGKDVKSNLRDNDNPVWANAGFEAARTTGKDRAQYGTLEASWWEQRLWGKDIPLGALPDGHGLKTLALEEIDDINQPVPPLTGLAPLPDPGAPTKCGATTVGFDVGTGAINYLLDSAASPAVQWASGTRTLLGLGYRTYSQDDFATFQKQYSNLTNPPGWFAHDFGKPGETISNHSTWGAKLQSAWVDSRAANATTFVVVSRIVDDSGSVSFPHTDYGAPERFVTQIVVPHAPAAGEPRLRVTIWCVNKTSTRLPETMFVSFTPANASAAGAAAADCSWEMQKLGQWQKCQGDVVAGGSKHLHGVSIGSGVRFNRTGAGGALHSFGIEAVDTPVINLGEPLGFPVPCEKMDNPWDFEPNLAEFGVSSIFWNNLWGTNYVQWFPYNKDYAPVAGEANFISRYNLRF